MMLALVVGSQVQPPAVAIVTSNDAVQDTNLPATEVASVTSSAANIAIQLQADSVSKLPGNAISDSSLLSQTVARSETPTCPSVSTAHGLSATLSGNDAEVASVNEPISDNANRRLVLQFVKTGETQPATPTVCPAWDVDPLDETPPTQADSQPSITPTDQLLPADALVAADGPASTVTDDPADRAPLKTLGDQSLLTDTAVSEGCQLNTTTENLTIPRTQMRPGDQIRQPDTAVSINEQARTTTNNFVIHNSSKVIELETPLDFEWESKTILPTREASSRIAPEADNSFSASLEKPTAPAKPARVSTQTPRLHRDEPTTTNSIALPLAVPQHVAGSSVISTSDQLVSAVMRRLDTEPGSGVSTFRLRLDPPDLGTVDVHLAVVDDVVSIRLVAHNESVRQIIDRQLEDLRQSLTNNGISFSECHVDCEAGGRQPHNQQEETRPPIPRQSPSGSGWSRLQNQEQRATLPHGQLNFVA